MTKVKCPYCDRRVTGIGLEDHIAAKHPERGGNEGVAGADMKPNWEGECIVCGQSPTLPLTGMCGPCTFGEADTAGGNW